MVSPESSSANSLHQLVVDDSHLRKQACRTCALWWQDNPSDQIPHLPGCLKMRDGRSAINVCSFDTSEFSRYSAIANRFFTRPLSFSVSVCVCVRALKDLTKRNTNSVISFSCEQVLKIKRNRNFPSHS